MKMTSEFDLTRFVCIVNTKKGCVSPL